MRAGRETGGFAGMRSIAMTRTLTPFTRFPRALMEMDTDFPRWMTRLFDEGVWGPNAEFMPEVDLVETDKGIEVKAELPGVKPEEVKLEVRDNLLWITGEKKEEKEEKGKTFHRVERRAGMFRRIFELPVEIEEEKVEAKFTEGVLKVTLPKAEKVAPKQIEVKA
jgi:HSP20 family protein